MNDLSEISYRKEKWLNGNTNGYIVAEGFLSFTIFLAVSYFFLELRFFRDVLVGNYRGIRFFTFLIREAKKCLVNLQD